MYNLKKEILKALNIKNIKTDTKTKTQELL